MADVDPYALSDAEFARQYEQRGRESRYPEQTFARSAASERLKADAHSLSDQEFDRAWNLLGTSDAHFDETDAKVTHAAAVAGTGSLLRADQEDQRRYLHTRGDKA